MAQRRSCYDDHNILFQSNSIANFYDLDINISIQSYIFGKLQFENVIQLLIWLYMCLLKMIPQQIYQLFYYSRVPSSINLNILFKYSLFAGI